MKCNSVTPACYFIGSPLLVKRMLDPGVDRGQLERLAREAIIDKQFETAEQLYKKLVELLESSSDARNQLEMAIALHSLAFVLDAQGKIAEADEIRERTSSVLLSKQ